MGIRIAEEKDVEEMLEIYNFEVMNGNANFDINPRSLEEWKEWFSGHNILNRPAIVYENDENGAIIGYATLSEYRTKDAYASTVELSVYVHKDYRRKGVASSLMREIIDMAKNDERTHLIMSVITSDNVASRRLHGKFGFTYCGTIPEVGIKNGKYLGVDNYYLLV